jgi:predicted small integral membrane protein
MLGHRLCAACKHRYVCELRRRGSNGAGEGQMTLMLALLGLIVCGPVISPLALMRGRALLREHRRDAAWAGRSTALAAVWISAVTLVLNAMMVLWVAGMAAWYGW